MRILSRFGGLCAVLWFAVAAYGYENTTVLGSGFTGRPYVITGDVFIEDRVASSVLRDLTDAVHPTWLGEYSHEWGFWSDVLVDGDLAVALFADSPSGYEVISLADLTAPASLGVHQGLTATSGWLGHGIFVMGRADDLIVFDLAIPTSPQVVAVKPLPNLDGKRWFSEVGDAVYCIDQAGDLRGFDLDALTDPTDLGIVTDLGATRIDAVVSGDGVLHALLWEDLGGGQGRLVLSTLAPLALAQFTETDRLTLASGTDLIGTDLVRDGDLLLATLNNGTVVACGLETPTQPSTGYVLQQAADHLALGTGKILINSGDVLFIYERTPYHTQPQLLVTREALPRLYDLVGAGSVVWAQSHYDKNQLWSVDVSNPWLPQMGEVLDTGVSGAIHHADDILLAAGGQKFQIVDVADPTRPQLRGAWVAEEYGVVGLKLARRSVAVGFWGGITFGIELYDLNDLDNPRLAAVIDGEGGVRALGPDLLVCGGNPLHVYDLTDLYRPALAGEFAVTGNIWNVALHDRHAYVVTRIGPGDDVLTVVDLNDPTAPEIVWSEDLPSAGGYELHVYDRRLHISGPSNLIYDLTNPAVPVLVGSYVGDELVAFNDEVIVAGETLMCILDETFGLAPAPEPVPVRGTRLETIFPNPANPSAQIAFTVEQTERLTVSIYDLKGRRVADLARTLFEPGRYTVTWRGVDDAGRAMASAVYYVRLHGPRTDQMGKITLLK